MLGHLGGSGTLEDKQAYPKKATGSQFSRRNFCIFSPKLTEDRNKLPMDLINLIRT